MSKGPREPWPTLCQYPGCGAEFMTASYTAKFCPEHRAVRARERAMAYVDRQRDTPEFKERYRKNARRWRLENPERAAEVRRKSRARHLERRRQETRNWYARNRQYMSEYGKRCRLLRKAALRPDDPILGMAVLAPELVACPRMHVRHRKELCGTREYCRGCEMCPTGFGKPQFKLGVAI